MAVDFTNVWNTLKAGIVNLAEKDLKDFVAQATKDGQGILDQLKDDLQKWTQQIADGSLTQDELEELILGQKDELEMEALMEAGLAEIQIDQFKADVFNLITTTLTALI